MNDLAQDERKDAPAGSEPPVRKSGSVLRIVAVVLALAGAALLAFGFWGTHAAAARFGDGFVPIGAGSLGGMLLIAGIIVDIAAERRSKKAT